MVKDERYTYLFIRRDIPLHAQLIQSSHAALELGLQLKQEKKPKQVSNLILLDATDLNHLESIENYLGERDIEYHKFFEPDHPINSHTAICTEPLTTDKKKYFKNFTLWK